MFGFNIFVIVLLVLFVAVLAAGVKIVPQGWNYTIERPAHARAVLARSLYHVVRGGSGDYGCRRVLIRRLLAVATHLVLRIVAGLGSARGEVSPPKSAGERAAAAQPAGLAAHRPVLRSCRSHRQRERKHQERRYDLAGRRSRIAQGHAHHGCRCRRHAAQSNGSERRGLGPEFEPARHRLAPRCIERQVKLGAAKQKIFGGHGIFDFRRVIELGARNARRDLNG